MLLPLLPCNALSNIFADFYSLIEISTISIYAGIKVKAPHEENVGFYLFAYKVVENLDYDKYENHV